MNGSSISWRACFASLPALLVPILWGCGDGDGTGLRPCPCPAELSCVDGYCAPAVGGGGAPEPPAGPVRVFAVGLHPVASDFESQATFRGSLRARIDADVVPSLASDRPNLIVFPENAGLMAPIIGERGAAARTEASITAAYLDLATSYADAAEFYVDRAVTALGAGRIVTLAVTDTLWRSLAHFAELARDLGAWVAVTYNVADAARATDPALVRILVDEGEADRSFAWVATGDEVLNQTLLYDPSGELVFRWAKEYLVPAEERGLDLAYGALGNVVPFEAPWGPTASVISKDAWMPDVLDRLALGGARLMLQPEAFSGWGVLHGEDASWAPDVVKESGWAHVMRYPEFRANALPCLSGNLFEMVFDCQSAVIVDAALTDGTGAFIGQDPDVGFVDVAPWVVDDDGMGTLDERRARLIETGERLLPGSGDPLENAYVAGVAWADVDLGAPWPPHPEAAAGVAVAHGRDGPQRRPALADLGGGEVLIGWEETASPWIARRLPDGTVSEGGAAIPAGTARALRLAGRGLVVHAAWQEAGAEGSAVRHARSSDGGRSFGPARNLGAGWVPDVAVDPADGSAHLVWIDTRGGPGRVFHARVSAGGELADPAAVEAPPPPRYGTRHNRWSPAVAARDGVVVILWADFADFRWSIRGAVSRDGGASFGEPFRVDDADVPHETIHSDPRVAILDDGAWLAAWTDLRVRRPDYDVRARRLDPASPGSSPPSLLLAASDTRGRPQWELAIAARGRRVIAVWQDLRSGQNGVRAAWSDDGGASFGADVAVAEDAGVHRWNPAVTMADDGTALVAWESSASGERRVRLVELPAP